MAPPPPQDIDTLGETAENTAETKTSHGEVEKDGEKKEAIEGQGGKGQNDAEKEEGEEKEKEEEEEEEEEEEDGEVTQSQQADSRNPSTESHPQSSENTPKKEDEQQEEEPEAPPLPDEELPPPLPTENPPSREDDGWEPVWEPSAQAFYFYNRFSGASQWENPRVPDPAASTAGEAGDGAAASASPPAPAPVVGGYNPAIHGDYDPTAPYAQQYEQPGQDAQAAAAAAAAAAAGGADAYAALGTFNRFTGRWQTAEQNPERHNDENKSRRQMGAYFDVDAAANSHDGRSLRAERSAKKLSRKELKMFKEKRKEKKEEKRRAWLRD